MQFFDLHCDTLYKATTEGVPLKSNNMNIDLDRGKRYKAWYQCFAVWVPDDIDDDSAKKLFESCYTKFLKELKSLSNTEFCPILTIENLKLIGNNIDYLTYLHNCGVKVATLTWKGENAIGGGNNTDADMTDFGKRVVSKMEELGIVIDISHANEKLFWGVCENTKKPLIATHSNSRQICDKVRNLSDDQIKAIIKRNGIIGLNFYKAIITEKHNPKFSDLLKHAEHMLELGAKDNLSIGSDFDGADIISKIKGIQDIEKLAEYFLKHNYSETLVNKIFFDNAYNFFDSNIELL